MLIHDKATRVVLTHTATDDEPFRLTGDELYYYDVTIWVSGNDCFTGTGNIIAAPVTTAMVYSDRNGNLADLWFKNRVAGSNTVITAMATIPNDLAKSILGYT